MNFFKACFSIRELYFTILSWVLIVIIQLTFSWFFIQEVNFITYLFPLSLIFVLYIGYLFSGKYYIFQGTTVKNNLNVFVLWSSIIAFGTVLFKFIDFIGNFSKDLSAIREERLNYIGNYKDTLYVLLFFLLVFSFIIANFNNLKYKKIVNVLALLSCVAFIPINGGRVNFLIFGTLYICIYTFKNFEVIKKNIIKRFLFFILTILLISIVMTYFSTLRLGADNTELVNHLNSLQYINSSAVNELNKLSYGVYLIIFISTLYDYTGSNIYHLSIFVENLDKFSHVGFGVYQFNFLIKFNIIDYDKIHDDIDSLYVKHGINHNIWATSFRETITDFGILGSYIYVFILALILFKVRKYIAFSYSAQILYFLTLSFFIFSPFHSIFYISSSYGFAYISAIFLFIFRNFFKFLFARN